jgi:phosphatidylserine/phosphatidylglycerophosphate/cardiolipin synthase-like enzyme
MNRYLFTLSAMLVLVVSACACPSAVPEISVPFSGRVYFSPAGGATEAVVGQINSAQTEILVQTYYFTSAPIGGALIEAHKRGVRVEVVLDPSQAKPDGQYCPAKFFFDAGIPVYIDSAHQIAHNKIMIVDRLTVVTGSFNFTRSAEERNAENLLVIPSKELASEYLGNWLKHKQHSTEYEARQ